MPDTALPQCPTCSGVAGSHTLACTSPEASGMYSARGNEVCDQCKVGFAAGEVYTHVEEDGISMLTCLGCACHAAIGTTS